MVTNNLSRFFLSAILLFSACAGPTRYDDIPTAVSSVEATLTPFQPNPATPTAKIPRIWIDPAVPDALKDLVFKQGYPLAISSEIADIRLGMDVSGKSEGPAWLYALVGAFPTTRDGVTFEELKTSWTGGGPGLVMTESTHSAMRILFGAGTGAGTRIVPPEALKSVLWQEPGSWGIVPFEALEPEMKVLEIDGRSPIRKDFEAANYPLKVEFRLEPELFKLPASNRDPAKLTTVLMTGTTALVRAISYKMQTNGIDYPARDIIDWLRNADILHISNEVAFTPECPAPDPNDGHLRFCSAEVNIGLLDEIGADVIELSGNHVNDWGTEALGHTLDLYQQRGWPVFAGGTNLDQSRQPAILERNGVKFAFIGCNSPGPNFAWATSTEPGASPCGDYQWLVDEIHQLKASGVVVIVALQDYEYYTPEPRPEQQEVFRRLAEAGADIVSGSQAHYSQAMEFHNGTFIHYGLGNLFFDQMWHDYPDGTSTTNIRREFLDRHVFYNGKYISTELLTTMLEDYAKPRPMTPDERQAFLEEYFKVSGWIQ